MAKDGSMPENSNLANLLFLIAGQVSVYDKRAQSRIEKQYGESMQRTAGAIRKILPDATFEQLLLVERMFQRNDLTVYAQAPSTVKSVEQGIRDFADGEAVCRQLRENPQAYLAHKYRESERAAPDKLLPLDAMRRALRGQANRVENYRRNVMGNPNEQEFLSARIALLQRAEELYDGMQRAILPASHLPA